MKFISTPDAPIPAGHYSQAVVHGGLVFVAGQLPIDPSDPSREPGPIEDQTAQALANVGAILGAAGTSLDRVVQMTVYVSDVSLWGKVNAVYSRVMGNHRPARAIVPSGELRHGMLIEIQAIAALEATGPETANAPPTA
ncbi:MAG TPA: RidA family protein [Gemmatimonadaceae bacterium]|nr:RidA family protein [Gemmatimonadaceae bacterium]